MDHSLKILSASSVLSNDLAPQPTVGAELTAVCMHQCSIPRLSLGVTQLIASETKRGCSQGILYCWSCSVLSARGAVCQVWLPPPSEPSHCP